MENLNKFVTKYKNGDIIYKKGDIQTEFFIINSGKVQIKGGGDDFILITLAKGDFFGEESLNSEQNAAYTVEVIEESDIIKIPYLTLAEMMKQHNDIALKILKKMSEIHIRIQKTLITRTPTAQIVGEQRPAGDAKSEETTSEKIGPNIKAYLVIQRSNRTVPLTKIQTYLGRRDYTTGFVPDTDLTEEDEEKYISRKHAKIFLSEGKFYLSEESGAINGTFLNGNKLDTGIKYEIQNNDEITLCHLSIIFKS